MPSAPLLRARRRIEALSSRLQEPQAPSRWDQMRRPLTRAAILVGVLSVLGLGLGLAWDPLMTLIGSHGVPGGGLR